MDQSYPNPSAGPLAADYSRRENWLKLPEVTQPVDVFYLYPTCYMGDAPGEVPVCEANHLGMQENARYLYELQARLFTPLANVFVPFYSQTSMAWFLSQCPGSREALAFQRGPQRRDVFAALDYYFEVLNQGRPYFLAGHSQGSMMLCLILEEYMAAHPERYSRMIAAYAPGCAISRDWLAENPHIRAVRGEADTGCLIGWNTEGPGNKGHANFVLAPNALCVNPLNWRLDDTCASPRQNLGSLGKRGPVPELTGARIDSERGSVVVQVGRVDKNGLPALFGPDSWHSMDYGFFWANLQENVRRRAESWFRTGSRKEAPV